LILFVMVAKSAGWIGKKEKTSVEIAEAKQVNITEKVNASGKIQPEIEVKLSPDVSGEVTELNIQEGDSVVKGQLLLRIRPDNYELAVQRSNAALNTSKANLSQTQARALQAEAQFVRATASFGRNKQLHEQKIISDAEFDQATADFKVAQQELESAKQSISASQFNVMSASSSVNESISNLSRTSIYAPVSGIVSKLNVEKGERVVGTMQMAGTELLRIANLNDMEVRVDVNENDIVRVTLGDTADVEVDAYSGRKFKGLVTSIANTAKTGANGIALSADAITEFEVKIRIVGTSYADLKAKTGKLSPFRPGMTASVEIITEARLNILSVPISAVTAKSSEEIAKKNSQTGDAKKPDMAKKDDKKDKKQPKDDKKEYVFVYDEKTTKVSLKEVKTGISDFDNIEIISGLKQGEKIVTAPFQAIAKTLKDGDEVSTEKANSSKNKKETK
jgi:HlyD family secretion protein